MTLLVSAACQGRNTTRMRPVEDLTESVNELLILLGPLAALLPEKPNKPGHGGRAKRAHSPAPWNGPAAGVWMDIHAGARQFEQDLCALVGLPVRSRGGSDRNTVHALERLPVLAERDADGRSWQVTDAARFARRWVRDAEAVLGLHERITRLPKQPAHDPPVCPYCRLDTLRWDRANIKVFCSNPTCRDDDGRRPVARPRGGVVSGQESMVFVDGMMLPPGLPRLRPDLEKI
jgi:hypothetical protein